MDSRHRPAPSRSGWIALAVCASILAAGCSDDPGEPKPAPTPVREYWNGTFVDAADAGHRGALFLDLTTTGTEIGGEIVLKSWSDDVILQRLFLAGSATEDTLDLQLDTEAVPYEFTFDLQLVRDAGSALTGRFDFPAVSLTADVACEELAVQPITVLRSFDLEARGLQAIGLAHDGTQLWISTLADYWRMDAAGDLIDDLIVEFHGARWSSDVLTVAGDTLWGHLPATIQDGSGTRNVSLIIEFTSDGDITGEYYLPHRSTGLATDGSRLWSLESGTGRVYRFDDSGAILESFEVAIPDLVDLEFDGASFWAIGWFSRKLFQFDPTGRILAAYRLPEEADITVFPQAIAWSGTSFWYCHGTIALDSRLYELSTSPEAAGIHSWHGN
jgi:hypothetical protein